MNADRGEVPHADEGPESPSISEWRPGADLPELNAREIRVWIVDLDSGLHPDNVETEEPGPELGLLSEDERARAARFVRARDRRRFARCRASLRQILGGLLRESPHSLRFRATGQGKPELDFKTMGVNEGDARAAIRFNVSHSSDLALIGVCRGHELGVDVERIKRISEADRIVASFFSPAERAEFATIPNDLKALAFFRGWTRKEAVLKGLGIGLAGLSARYETGFGMTDLPAHFIPATPSPQVEQWQLWEAAPRAGFVATVAVGVPLSDDLAEPARRGAGGGVACPGEKAVH
jgi:4'-phosphopantetheinyl transferase